MLKKKFYLLIFILTVMANCQNKKEMEQELFDWQEGLTSPAGFPTQIYVGGLTSGDGTYVGFSDGLNVGYWGSSGSGMSSGEKPLPKFLHVKWLSFAERCFYEVDTELDYDKMYKLFKEGYLTKMGALGIQRKTYNVITTGFAPGGVVVVWISGIGKQTEVGCYQGKKITIPQSEIDKLDSDRAQMFDQSDWQRALDNNRENLNNDDEINPAHIDLKKKLDNNPIPFGLWDAYRIRYSWKPVFVLQDGAFLDKKELVRLEYFNGEVEEIFNEKFIPQKIKVYSNQFLLPDYEKRAKLKGLGFVWKDNSGNIYNGWCELNEESITNAYKEIYGSNPENIKAELDIRVNIPNTFFTVMLKGNDKEIFIKTDAIGVN